MNEKQPEGNFKTETCSICQKVALRHPHKHNASPVNEGYCCTQCNQTVVIPARLRAMRRARNEK